MQIPDSANVVPFDITKPGSLVCGRFHSETKNFFAISTTRVNAKKDASPSYMAVLPPSEHRRDGIYFCEPATNPIKVLNLGTDWLIDVDVGHTTPAFDTSFDSTLLVRSEGRFFMKEQGGHWLDLKAGAIFERLPNAHDVAVWPQFSILMGRPWRGESVASLYHWNRLEPRPRSGTRR